MLGLIKKLIILLMLSPILLSISSCEIRTAKFEFDVEDGVIKVYDNRIEYALLTVRTTCTSGWDYYENGNPPTGGKPTLLLFDGSAIEGTTTTNDIITQVDIRRGDVIERTWEFYLPDGFEPGEYTVKVSWNKSVETFENVSFTRKP